jgi:hypothetical protein
MQGTHKRFTISVSGRTYERLRRTAPKIGPFVDQIVASALDDPKICERLVAVIHGHDEMLS